MVIVSEKSDTNSLPRHWEKNMSNMNLPEWTAQALVAVGAVFLLISAYVMGVYVPNAMKFSDDFDVNIYFDGTIDTFDFDAETGTGAFVDNVGTGSYDPTATKNEGGATLNVVADPSKSTDDYTHLSQNFSLTTDGLDGEGVWLGTIAESESYLHRSDYTSHTTIGGEATQGTWTPNNPPEEGKEFKFANPVNSDHIDTFTCGDSQTIDGLEVLICTANETATKIPFTPSEGSDLHLLQTTIEGFSDAAGPGSAPMWFEYKSVQTVGKELGSNVNRLFEVTIYMTMPSTLVYLNDNFTTVTYYEGVVGGIDTSDPFFGADYYNATGKKAGYVNSESSNANYINVTGFLNIFKIEYDENGTAKQTVYDNVDSEDPNSTFQEVLVNATYDVNRTSLKYLQADGSDSFTFFSPTCETISTVDSTCWVPAENQSWPNPFSSLKTVPGTGDPLTGQGEPAGIYMQNYTFIGVDSEYQVFGVPSYHFRANETGICCFYRQYLGDMHMNYYEDVWVDPMTGTVLNQRYDVQLTYDMPFGPDIIRDIDASFTEDQIADSISGAGRQALAQYYQGQDVVALRLVGQYTESEQANQIETAKENEAAKKLGTVTLPGILIGSAMVCLMAGFYVYYQNGGGISEVGMDEPSSEPESSPEMAPTTEEDSTEEEAADDSSDGDSDAEEESESDDEQSESEDE